MRRVDDAPAAARQLGDGSVFVADAGRVGLVRVDVGVETGAAASGDEQEECF